MEHEDESQSSGAAGREPEAANEEGLSPRLESEGHWSDGEALSLYEI